MIKTDANRIAAHTKALLPKMNDEQVKLLRDVLESDVIDAASASARLQAYAESVEEFTTAGVLHAARGRPRGYVDFAARTAQQLASEQAHATKLAAEWAKIDAVIAHIADDELERLKAEVLASIGFVGASARRKNPRENRWLKGLIAQQLVPELLGADMVRQ